MKYIRFNMETIMPDVYPGKHLFTNGHDQLKTITQTLLSSATGYASVRDACSSLSSFFCELSGFDMESLENREHQPTQAGLAVSPFAAAFCITDMLRTRNFIRGIKEAIDEKLKTKPNEPVKVFYAGTGPFATLLIPLTTIYTPSQLQLILMDINPISIKHLKFLIERLKMQSYIIDVVESDALTYIIPNQQKPDILVSETMKPGLQKEPQVSIVANLLSQCHPDAILIPELVKVNACLAGNLGKDPGAIIFLQTLFEFDSQIAKRINDDPGNVPILSEGVVIEIKNAVENYGRLVLTTEVIIFNDHRLRFNESSLSVRHEVMNISDIKKIPARLLFRYKMENEPGFMVTELE